VLTALNTTVRYTRDLRDAITVRADTVGSNKWHQWYDYDTRGLLWKVSASTTSSKPGTPDVTYTYRPSGQIATRQFQGGPQVPLAYTVREQLRRIGDTGHDDLSVLSAVRLSPERHGVDGRVLQRRLAGPEALPVRLWDQQL
jgi:hypothetical protein